MYINCDKYVEYLAYKWLYEEFKKAITDTEKQRYAVNVLKKILYDCCDKLSCSNSDLHVRPTDSVDMFINVQRQYNLNNTFCMHLYEAREKFKCELEQLDRPTTAKACKTLHNIVTRVGMSLLE